MTSADEFAAVPMTDSLSDRLAYVADLAAELASLSEDVPAVAKALRLAAIEAALAHYHLTTANDDTPEVDIAVGFV
jgi:outer membrane murein-binding lipoprotein Lpp